MTAEGVQLPCYGLKVVYSVLRKTLDGSLLLNKDYNELHKAVKNFEEKKCNILVSTALDQNLLKVPKVKVILFDEEHFKSVVFSPPVCTNNIEVVAIRTQYEETRRKLNKIDNLMRKKIEVKSTEYHQKLVKSRTLPNDHEE